MATQFGWNNKQVKTTPPTLTRAMLYHPPCLDRIGLHLIGLVCGDCGSLQAGAIFSAFGWG